MIERIRLWTDGCCLSNPGGPGGWAFVAEYRGREIDAESGGTAETNENRMELAAVAQALLYVARVPIEIVTDAHYILHYATRGERGPGWWPNRDLWTEIDRLLGGRQVRFSQVKGHRHEFNIRADHLAKESARKARRLRRARSRPIPQPAGSPPSPVLPTL